LRVRAFWDLGRRDATAIWIAQFVGRSINVLDYIEGQGQHISFYVEELRRRGYDTALMVLPHDGAAQTVIAPGSAREQLTAAGFDVDVIPNQGKGAALNRVEASRRLFPNIWFADEQTRAGRKALGAYHERRDDKRNVGLGPEHDWASDPADAFGLMCVAYEAPMEAKKAKRVHATAGGWLG
jgi:phage terminase large subunit